MSNQTWKTAGAEAALALKEKALANALERNKQLTKQRDAALKAAEDARKTSRPVIKPPKHRVRLKDDIVRFIFGDVHGFRWDEAAFGAMLADCKRFTPDEIIMGGDMVNCGGFLAQHHTMGYVAETEETYEQDIAMANQQFDSIQNAAGNAKVDYMAGNHEDRVEKWAVTETLRHPQDSSFLMRMVAPETLLSLKKRGINYFKRSEHYDNISIPGWIRRGKVFFTHEISTAKNAAAVAVSSSGGNVVYFHSHRSDYSVLNLPGVGLIGAWCPGCLCKLQPLWRHTTPTNWTHGYAIQLVARSGSFCHVNVLIEKGHSLVGSLLS